MISNNCDIREFIPELKNKDFFEMIYLIDKEATEAERPLFHPQSEVFEGQPGHQASGSRGGFGAGAFGGTRGGPGKYSAEVGGLWDALLGEGRNWWLFASSDWHNRGNFAPYDVKTTGDFWTGEFQKDYLRVNAKYPEPQDIIDAMRSGNSFTVMGDLIDDLLNRF